MKTLSLCAVMVMSVIVCGVARAGESRSPEQLGGHWARVSDEAEIQLIVDELRANGGGTGGVARKLVSQFVLHLQHGQAVLTGVRNGIAAALVQPQATERCRVHVQGSAASVVFPSGDRLELEKIGGRWMVTGGTVPSVGSASTVAGTVITHTTGEPTNAGVSVGETFIPVSVSREHGIDRLTKQTTRTRLARSLFGLPNKTASYYAVRYFRSLPGVSATYIQLVLDPEWNRIIYGNMDRWIKAYAVQAPSALAVDTDGHVFVGEPTNKRVLVLQLTGSDDNVELQHRHTIGVLTNPSDIAVNDNATPFDTRDDYLYIADATENVVYKYTGGSRRNERVAVFEGFETPTALAVGRWNGTNTNVVYVVDKLAKRIRVFLDEGTSLSLLNEFRGSYDQSFSSLKVDHFGNVYAVEQVRSRLFKFTSMLEFLDVEGGTRGYEALGVVDIPFAKVEIEGRGASFAGFDQVFAIERWDEASGAQRRKLGVKMKEIAFSADEDVSSVASRFVLTDVADVTVRIYDEQNRLVRTLASSWMTAGQKHLLWDRRGDDGSQVAAGTYRYEIGATSAYGGEPLFSNTRFTLPLYYHEDCGSSNRYDDAHLVQGSAVRWGNTPSQTANESASSVVYRFSGLDPESEYEVAAEFAAGDGIGRLQTLTANGVRLGDAVRVGATPTRAGFFSLPKSTYEKGEVTIAVNAVGEGSAIVTQLWIKQVGVGFKPEPIATIPTKYLLAQNYPNPFNPSTTIRYALPADAHVTLKVYTIAGQEVATLVNGQQSAGSYEVTFDPRNSAGARLASGIYFYRITAGTYSQTRKMVLLK